MSKSIFRRKSIDKILADVASGFGDGEHQGSEPHLRKELRVKEIYMLSTNSFPSGHTVEAFTIATVLSYVTPNKRWGFIFLILAICVGYSRMYLSEHFFEDVTAGSIIGTMATIIWITFIDSQPFLHQSKWSKGILNRDRV